MTFFDQWYADRLDVAEDPSAASHALLEVSPGLLELGHCDCPGHLCCIALAPQQPGRVVDLVTGRYHEQDSVGRPQPGTHLTHKVGIAGCVEEIDAQITAGDRGGAQRQRRSRLTPQVAARNP